MTRGSVRVQDLPAPPPGRTGFPWTEGAHALPATLPGGMNYPKITVVTPSYQQGQFLEETIRSVLLQGYPNLEYFVMDGGSRDNSVEVIQKYAPFLSFWVSERDKGQANAINKGFARSSGEIMGWLNSDDILLPGALYWIARSFIERPQVGFVTGFRKIIDQNSRVTVNFVRDIPTNYYMRHYCCIAQETTYWRRSAWDKLGPIDESLHFALDYDYWLRAIQNGYSFSLIPHYIGGFRDYLENKSSSWKDVYYHDIHILYHRYGMGENEADVHAKLGQRWADRYTFYEEISKQRWTNSPRLVELAWRVLETQGLSDAIVALWKLINAYRSFRRMDRMSRQAALRSIAGRVFNRITGLVVDKPVQSQPLLGNVQNIPDYANVTDRVSWDALPSDTLAFGRNWYPTEFYYRDYFRWSSGEGEIHILKASGQRTNLKLIVAPGVTSSEHRLDLLDTNGTLLASTVMDLVKVEIDVELPARAADDVRYQLRWIGATQGENWAEQRRLAFRILTMGWHRPATPLEAAYNRFQLAVDALIGRRAVDKTPGIGLLMSAVRRWRRGGRAMQEEAALWRAVVENLEDLNTQAISPVAEPPAAPDMSDK